MKHLLLLLLCLLLGELQAQTTVGLVAYYPFDTTFADVTGNTANNGIPQGNPAFVCGIKNNSATFDGLDDRLSFLGQVNDEFDTEDLTISFYFNPTGINGTQYIMSKRETDCGNEYVFYIRYVPSSRTLNVFFSENPSKTISLIQRLESGVCWYHVVVVRVGTRIKLYINGKFTQDLGSNTRIDVENDADLILGGGDCLVQNEVFFDGLIDDLRLYNRALDAKDIEALYFSPDMIVNRDTVIFLGNTVDVALTKTCASSFSWSPMEGVSNPFAPEPRLTPNQAGIFVYSVDMTGNLSSCVATDSIRITVVDPNELDCAVVFLPKAFTPNGDGLNDTYGISNPFAVQELISFEIFDRWGNRVFATNDPFESWDGVYKGEELNPGIMLYRIRFRCEGKEKLNSGSLTVLR